jgi:hypothetical protein
MLIFGLVVSALGSTFMITLRSLVALLVLPNHVGTLYSLTAVAQGAGLLLAGPILANVFHLAMVWGEHWMGLPYLLSSAMFLGAVATIYGDYSHPIL